MFGSDRLQSLCRLKARDVMATSVFDKIFQNPQQRHFFFARKLIIGHERGQLEASFLIFLTLGQ